MPPDGVLSPMLLIIYISTLQEWLASREFKLSTDKSSSTIFSTWSEEVSFDPQLSISGQTNPLKSKPKTLGVTFESMLNFLQHITNTRGNLQKRNNIIKTLSVSNWGCSKETLSATYMTIARSVLNHRAPIWTPAISNTNWSSLQ